VGVGVGVLAAGEVRNVILYVDGLSIEVTWMPQANMSNLTGEAGERAMRGMA
jgi:hypothetical protein